MKPNFFRYYCFDLLVDEQFDQICLVDADTIIHPECPNFFNIGTGFRAVHNDGDYDWVIRSVENYQSEFTDVCNKPFDNIWKYFNSGFLVITKEYESFFKYFIEFYWKYQERIINCQKRYGVGTDQPLINMLTHWHNVDVTLLPYQFNMQEIPRKNILDDRMLFTRIPGIYHFNGIPGGPEQANPWIEKTYKYLYEN